MLSKSFKSGKCKTSLKLAVSRIKLLKNRRDIQVKHLRRELAQLLATGQEQTARIRVEHVIREEKTTSAYDLIEIYCELIVARLPIIESQKTCPIDLKEAISSVIFASPRCADVPELLDIRKQFVAKYGKDFATSALELRPDCGVNRMIVEKLSAKTPDIETKIKIMTAIAKEHDVKWDSKPFEEELQKPKEDLLNGSSSFMRANMNSMESLKGSFSPGTGQKEAVSNIIQNEIPSKPTSSNSSSHTNSEASTSPVQVARKESMTSGRKPGVSEARDSYSNEGTAASNQPTWTMEFKDAVSAAQVAAESAERASMAARAAAALAGHRNVSRQNSNDPNGSSIHGSSNVVPNRVLSSKLKDEHSESVNMNYNRDEGYQVVKEKIDKLPRDEELGRGISHHNADDTEFSLQTNNAEKFGGFRESFSRTKFVGSKNQHDEVEFVEDNVKANYDRSTSASSITAFEDDTKDDTIWSPTGKHQTGSFQQVHDDKQHAFSDFSAPVFDDYDPEPIDRRNLLDSFDSIKEDQNFHSNAPISSAANSNIFKAPLHESSSTIKTGKVPSSKFDDVKSVAYDDSDGISSDEEDMNRSFKSRTTQNSVLFHEERSSSPDSGRGEELQPSSSSKSISMRGSEEKDQLQLPSSVGTKETELASGGEFGLHFGRLAGGLRNRGYNYPPYTAISVTDSPVSSKETASSTFSSTDRTSSRQENKFTSPIIEEDSRYVQESSWNASTNPETLKEQGFRAEESIQTIRSNKNLAREKSVEDTSSFSLRQNRGDKQDPFDSTNTNVSGSEAIHQKTYDKNPHTKTLDEPIFQMSRTNFDSDGDMGERSKENPSASSNIKLSRRTRDVTTKGRNNLPRSTAYSDSPTEDFESQSLHQTVQEANILPRNSNLKPGNPILSEKSEKGPTPDTIPTSSDNSTPSDSGGGTKVKGTEQRKASHVHPKLPDYETLAAHFQSLRSNRR